MQLGIHKNVYYIYIIPKQSLWHKKHGFIHGMQYINQ